MQHTFTINMPSATHAPLNSSVAAPILPRNPPPKGATASPKRHLHIAHASKKSPMTEADLYIAVESSTGANPPAPGTPWYVSVPAGFVATIAVLRVVRALTRRSRNSKHLEERGYKRGGGTADEDHYTKLMKGMKTVQYDDLSPELVEAARRRRRQEIERDGGRLELEKIDLPENHPFAVKQKVTKEEEEMQRLRMSARRGLSPEDMRLLKQQQQLADTMEAEEEARDSRGGRRQ